MKFLHLLASGNTGGIETLCKDYGVFSNIDNRFIFPWNGGATTEEMKNANLNVIELKLSKKDLYGTLRAIYRVCKDEKIDAIVEHHTSPILLFYLVLLKKRFPQIKTVAYAHCNAGDMQGGNGNRGLTIKKWLIKKSFQKVDCVVAISRFVEESLIKQFHISADKITLIYNGVDVEKMATILHPKHSPAEIIYVGRLIEQKGVQVILKALKRLPEIVDWNFSIVGDGEYRSNLERQVLDLGLGQRVTFLGNCRNVPELLAQADIFVHAPILEEGFGITIVEAMAAGILCIGSKSGAIPEIIKHMVNGYLFEKGAYEELAQLLLSSINEYDTEEKKIVRRNAISTAKCFSVESFAENLDEILSQK
ncbi:glycosyltransferase [Anaerocolumna sedimenticola]|uniref:Glycosyltransferase n=1 Tax=Anaerocolumna sedimenticola TaxID=2696063 RepID=A0A6P1TFJ5_9FIRM|nr:glycosyltransferase family 4 protein [Anaerocolumna sedimenticola]QHQ59960.1 glycosyltransferase [Anaerocolumna sedimenticola]